MFPSILCFFTVRACLSRSEFLICVFPAGVIVFFPFCKKCDSLFVICNNVHMTKTRPPPSSIPHQSGLLSDNLPPSHPLPEWDGLPVHCAGCKLSPSAGGTFETMLSGYRDIQRLPSRRYLGSVLETDTARTSENGQPLGTRANLRRAEIRKHDFDLSLLVARNIQMSRYKINQSPR